MSALRLNSNREFTEVQKTERQVKSILNKLTREKFDSLYSQLLACCENAEARSEIVQVVAREVFSKATQQHTFVEMYADVCAKLHADLQNIDDVEVNFKRILLEHCRESFTQHLEPPRIDTSLDYEEQYEVHVKYKTKMLGNVRLIGHLLRQRMLSSKIVFLVTDELLSIGSPEALETLSTFLETLGSAFDNNKEWNGRAKLEEVFTQVELLSLDSRQPSRTRCLLKDLLDKRRRQWRPCPSGGTAADPPATPSKDASSVGPSRSPSTAWGRSGTGTGTGRETPTSVQNAVRDEAQKLGRRMSGSGGTPLSGCRSQTLGSVAVGTGRPGRTHGEDNRMPRSLETSCTS